MLLSSNCSSFKLGIFGASGFAKEIADIILEFRCVELVFLLPEPEEGSYFDFAVVSEKEIPRLHKDNFLFALGIGENQLRKKLFEKYHQLVFPNIIHSSVTMGYRQLERFKDKKGNILSAGVRFMNNINVGDFGIYDLNCTIGHDCIFDDFVHISPGANVAGNVYLKEGVYIGSNAAILQGKSIEKKMVVGEQTTIGAGAVVTNHIPPHSIAVGVPASVANTQD